MPIVGAQGEGRLDVLRTTTHALNAVHSEAASQALAEQVVRRYRSLDSDLRLAYLGFLAVELGPNPLSVKAAIEAWQSVPSADTLWAISRAVEAPRQALFRAITSASRGTQAVVDLRGEVLSHLQEHPELLPVERDLHHVLSSWFRRGFIELQRISWQSPGEVLEKIIAYEAVHEVTGWDDLRRRLEPDRRCYGFFHPAMPYEPLVFVEVALTDGMPSTIGDVLHAPSLGEQPPLPADTATFYSISSCQPGLAGIPLGDFLIKQVAEALGHELPDLRHFVTLSPIPGFRAWLEPAAHHRHRLPAENVAMIAELAEPDWYLREEIASRLRPMLERLCAVYLVTAKRGPQPADPVARFHLRNGARILAIKWLADPSGKGIRQSAGLMVNYEYDEVQVVPNHEAYVNDGIVARSPEIDRLLDAGS